MNKRENTERKPFWIPLVSIVAVVFGIATIKEGGSALFTEVGKSAAGNFVPFVLWFNFAAGFAYVFAGIALFKLKGITRPLTRFIAVSTVAVFLFFCGHIVSGGAYELRTVAAMTLRSSVWICIAVIVHRSKVFNLL